MDDENARLDNAADNVSNTVTDGIGTVETGKMISDAIKEHAAEKAAGSAAAGGTAAGGAAGNAAGGTIAGSAAAGSAAAGGVAAGGVAAGGAAAGGAAAGGSAGGAAAAGTAASGGTLLIAALIAIVVIFIIGMLCVIPSALTKSTEEGNNSGITAETLEDSYSQWASECDDALVRIQDYAEEQVEKKIEQLEQIYLNKYNREHPDEQVDSYEDIPNHSDFDSVRSKSEIVSNAVSSVESQIPYVIAYYSYANTFENVKVSASGIKDDGTDAYINELIRKLKGVTFSVGEDGKTVTVDGDPDKENWSEGLGMKDILVAWGALYIKQLVWGDNSTWTKTESYKQEYYVEQVYTAQEIEVYVPKGTVTEYKDLGNVQTGDDGIVITTGNITQEITKTTYEKKTITVYVKGDPVEYEVSSSADEVYESDTVGESAEDDTAEVADVQQEQVYEQMTEEQLSDYKVLSDATLYDETTGTVSDESALSALSGEYYVEKLDDNGEPVFEDCETVEKTISYMTFDIPDMGDEWPAKAFGLDLYDLYGYDEEYCEDGDKLYMKLENDYVTSGYSSEDASKAALDRMHNENYYKGKYVDYEPYTYKQAAEDVVAMLEEAGIVTELSYGTYGGSFGWYSVTGGDCLRNFSCAWFNPSNGHGDQLLDAYCELIMAGYTRPAACAILANGITEGGFDSSTTVVYHGITYRGTYGTRADSKGWKGYVNFCAENGYDENDAVTETIWLVTEGGGIDLIADGYENKVQGKYYGKTLRELLLDEELQKAQGDGYAQTKFCSEILQVGYGKGIYGSCVYQYKNIYWPYSMSQTYKYQIMDRKDNIARKLYDATADIEVTTGGTEYLELAYHIAEETDAFYLWGGSGYAKNGNEHCSCTPSHKMYGMDCSGFVSYCLANTGVLAKGTRFYTSTEKATFEKLGWNVFKLSSSSKDLEPGDILFYCNSKGEGHTEIYYGKDENGIEYTVGAHSTPHKHAYTDSDGTVHDSKYTVEESISVIKMSSTWRTNGITWVARPKK